MDDLAALSKAVRAFQAARVVLTAAELDLFQPLLAGPLPLAALAAALGTDPRATEILLDGLVALGLLHKSADQYTASPMAVQHLASGSAESVLTMLQHQARLWDRWSCLTAVVREGEPAPRTGDPVQTHRAYIRAMDEHKLGQSLRDWLPLDLSGVTRIVDLGGGPGTLAVALARALPEAQVVLMDRPATLALAAEMVPADLWQRAILPRPCDLVTEENYGTGLHLAILSAVLHAYDVATCRVMVARAAAALQPGGRLVIREYLLQPDRAGPLREALFSINMLVSTARGRAFTEAEVEGWMRASGLEQIQRLEVEKGAALVGVMP